MRTSLVYSPKRGNLSFSYYLSLVSLSRWLFYLFYKHMSADVFILCLSSLFSYSIKIPPSLQTLHCLSVPYFHPICIHISALGMKTKLYMVLRFPTVQPPPHITLTTVFAQPLIHILCSVCVPPFCPSCKIISLVPLCPRSHRFYIHV